MAKRKRVSDVDSSADELQLADPQQVTLLVGPKGEKIMASRAVLAAESGILKIESQEEWQKPSIDLSSEDAGVVREALRIMDSRYVGSSKLWAGRLAGGLSCFGETYRCPKIRDAIDVRLLGHVGQITTQQVAEGVDRMGYLLAAMMSRDAQALRVVSGHILYVIDDGDADGEVPDGWLIGEDMREGLLVIMEALRDRKAYLRREFKIIFAELCVRYENSPELTSSFFVLHKSYPQNFKATLQDAIQAGLEELQSANRKFQEDTISTSLTAIFSDGRLGFCPRCVMVNSKPLDASSPAHSCHLDERNTLDSLVKRFNHQPFSELSLNVPSFELTVDRHKFARQKIHRSLARDLGVVLSEYGVAVGQIETLVSQKNVCR